MNINISTTILKLVLVCKYYFIAGSSGVTWNTFWIGGKVVLGGEMEWRTSGISIEQYSSNEFHFDGEPLTLTSGQCLSTKGAGYWASSPCTTDYPYFCEL